MKENVFFLFVKRKQRTHDQFDNVNFYNNKMDCFKVLKTGPNQHMI